MSEWIRVNERRDGGRGNGGKEEGIKGERKGKRRIRERPGCKSE